MHDLLNDPLIGIRANEGETAVCLPDLLARLASGTALAFTGLRAHQADPWHVFLVQIAASVMARNASVAAPPADVGFWRAGLLDLANGQSSAWQLVVEDVTKPAFLQHPLANAAELTALKPKASTPDELDVLVTAKDHDVKMARMDARDPQAWLYAVLTRQTLSGFLGAGNFGSARMNGGFASRCMVSLVANAESSARFLEEVDVLRATRRNSLSNGTGYVDRGVVLTWLTPWQRHSSQWQLLQLEPWFVEAVRPLRLVAVDSVIHAIGATSASRQIGPDSVDNGDIGDPWLPINVNDKKKGRSALTVSASGWTPELLCRLLFQDGIELTALQRPRAGMSGGAWFLGSVLVRGQGKTDGFHRFALPVPARACTWLAQTDGRGRLGRLAKELLSDAKEIERTLRGAVMMLAEGGPETVPFENDTLQTWGRAVVNGYMLGWLERFFPALWQGTETDTAAVRSAWQANLVQRARRALEDAQTRIPQPSGRRYRAQVRARGYFESSLRKKGLLPERSDAMAEEDAA